MQKDLCEFCRDYESCQVKEYADEYFNLCKKFVRMRRIRRIKINFFEGGSWDSVDYIEHRLHITIEEKIKSIEQFERAIKNELELLRKEIKNE